MLRFRCAAYSGLTVRHAPVFAEGNGDWPGAVTGEHDGEEEVIPGGCELPDKDDDKAGDGDGKQDPAVDAEHVGAVHATSLDQFGGQAGVIVAEG